MGADIEPGGIRFLRDQRHFSAVWHPPGKSSPPRVHFSTSAGPLTLPLVPKSRAVVGGGPFRGEARPRIESPAPLTLRSEKSLDRTGKRLGLNRETQTGDAAFDQLVYLESEAPDALLLATLADPLTRAGVMKCLELGASEIVLAETGNLEVILPLASEDQITPPRLEALLDALGAAAEAIPPLHGGARRRTTAGVITTVAVVGTLVAWPLYYLFDWLWKPIQSDLYRTAVFGGLSLWVVSIPILALILRGRATSLRDLATSLIFLAVGFPLCSVDLLLALNAALDGSSPLTHATRVKDLRRQSGKASAYFVTVSSWHSNDVPREIEISSSAYSPLAVNLPVVVTTRQGFFGWERMTSIVPATSPQTSN